jgi:hypothetical protein
MNAGILAGTDALSAGAAFTAKPARVAAADPSRAPTAHSSPPRASAPARGHARYPSPVDATDRRRLRAPADDFLEVRRSMDDNGYGWKLFAGIMVLLVGVFNVIDGLRAITSANQITSRFPGGRVELPVTNNLKVWGWVILIIGAVMILAGFLIFSGNMFGRIVGVAVASLNAIVQLSYLDHNTFWSFTMILVDILVIYALVAHGGRVDEWRTTDRAGS